MDFEFTPVESLEKVPAQFRPLYATQAGEDGKFSIAEPYKGTAEAFVGLGRALKAERAAAKNRTTVDLSPLQPFGSTVEEIATGVTNKIRTLEEQLAQGGKVDVEKIKQALAQAHQTETQKITTRAKALESQLYEQLVETAATAELGRPGKPRGSAELLMPIIRRSVKVTENDGKFAVSVVDGSGDLRYSGVTGQPLSIAELVDEMRTDARYARAFDSDAPSGGGAPPTGSKAPVRVVQQHGDVSPTDLIRQGLAEGGLSRRGTHAPGMQR